MTGPGRDRGGGPMRGWLATAGAALRTVVDRAELWIPGALAALAFAGWLPFVLAVVPLPDAGGLALFGAGLATSGAWPWNAVLLSLAVMFGVLTMGLLAALGESALQRGLRPLLGELGPGGARHGDEETLTGETAITFVVMLVAMLPAATAAMALALGIAAVAPGAYQSPDIGGPALVRIARAVSPFLAAFVVLVVVGQAFGAAVQRRAVGPRPETLGAAMAHGLGDLRRHPLPLLGVAVTTLLALAVLTVVATLLLRVLWAPIGVALAAGELASPQTVLLLVGFVAIWLCLVVAGGALHAWASAWWSLELRRTGRAGPSQRAEEPKAA